jgi:hypothetical protein
VGALVGNLEGEEVGARVGEVVGRRVGFLVGLLVGLFVGRLVALLVGAFVTTCALVGASVISPVLADGAVVGEASLYTNWGVLTLFSRPAAFTTSVVAGADLMLLQCTTKSPVHCVPGSPANLSLMRTSTFAS